MLNRFADRPPRTAATGFPLSVTYYGCEAVTVVRLETVGTEIVVVDCLAEWGGLRSQYEMAYQDARRT